MTTIPVWWPHYQPRIWDQTMLHEALAGELWPTPGVRFSRYAMDCKMGDGAIVVVSGHEMIANGIHSLDAELASLPWFLFIHTSDEQCRFQSVELLKVSKAPRRRWQQYANVHDSAYRNICIGYPPGTRAILRDLPRLPLFQRKLWAFSGQCFNPARQMLVQQLSQHNRGTLAVSRGFGQGLPHAGHLSLLAGAALAPCPTGALSPDSFRLYEALEAGCLPICDKRAEGWNLGSDFWRLTLGLDGAPFPTVDTWKEWPALFERYSSDPLLMQQHANKAGAWWLGYKRELVQALAGDALALSGQKEQLPVDSLEGKVTILVTTSPIPSNPETTMIENTLRELRADPALADCEILVLCDGVRAEQEHRRGAYEEFKRRLIDLCNWSPEFKGCLPIVHDEHKGQGLMVRLALYQLKAPLVLICEHDMWPWPGRKIDWLGIARVLDSNCGYKQIRLILDCELWPDRQRNLPDGIPYRTNTVDGVPLVRTMEYSSRLHMARADWYRGILTPHFGFQSRAHLEHGLHEPALTQLRTGTPWEKWGMAIYAPDPEPRGCYCDGRGADPMFEPVLGGD